jgi:hypothetical protein
VIILSVGYEESKVKAIVLRDIIIIIIYVYPDF